MLAVPLPVSLACLFSCVSFNETALHQRIDSFTDRCREASGEKGAYHQWKPPHAELTSRSAPPPTQFLPGSQSYEVLHSHRHVQCNPTHPRQFSEGLNTCRLSNASRRPSLRCALEQRRARSTHNCRAAFRLNNGAPAPASAASSASSQPTRIVAVRRERSPHSAIATGAAPRDPAGRGRRPRLPQQRATRTHVQLPFVGPRQKQLLDDSLGGFVDAVRLECGLCRGSSGRTRVTDGHAAAAA